MKKRTFLTASSAATLAVAAFTLSPTGALAESPTALNIGVILAAGIESPWEGTLIESFERIRDEQPHGLDISWQYTDPLWGDEAGDAMRLFAQSGQFDIIWAHSTYSDQVARLKDEFPEIMFVVVGSGNDGLGGNQYWVYKRAHEPAFIMGMIAGELSEAGTLGVVGTFPADDVNDQINAFFAGARSVRDDVTQKVAFIESWYDPARASEMTSAQIAMGADLIYSLASNFRPCEEAGILCFGNFDDQHSFSPRTVLSSALSIWDPDVNWIIDEWYDFRANGTPLDGNTEIIWRGMTEGGAAIAPFHGLADRVPVEVQAMVDDTIAQIMAGEFVVELDVSTPASD